MFKITNILNKLKSSSIEKEQLSDQELDAAPNINQPTSIVRNTRNWYEERSDKITVQRNILLLLLLMLITIVVASIIAVTFIINSKKFDPFVIQIDNNTGVATIVNPASSEILSGNDALTRYFIKKYLIARETYNPVDFTTEARTTVRLFSSNGVFYSYISYIRNKDIDPILKYGQNNTTFLTTKSWSKLDSDKFMVRFSVNEISGDKKIFNKIAVIKFVYIPMELTDKELDINPVGFQINEYRVDDDNS